MGSLSRLTAPVYGGGNMTLREYIIFWQETYDRYQSRSTTYAAHNYVFKNHILPGLGDVLLSELTSEMVGEFLEERKRFGNHRPGSSGLGEETMRHIHRLLQQCSGPGHTGRPHNRESRQGVPLPQVHNGESEYHDASGDGGLSGCRRAVGLPPHVHAGADDRASPRRAHRPEMERP